MSVNLLKLDAELRAACPRVVGCSSSGRVDFADGSCWRSGDPKTCADHETVAAIVAAHDPAPTRAQRLAAKGISEREAALVLVLRKGTLAPDWAKNIVRDLAADAEGA